MYKIQGAPLRGAGEKAVAGWLGWRRGEGARHYLLAVRDLLEALDAEADLRGTSKSGSAVAARKHLLPERMERWLNRR